MDKKPEKSDKNHIGNFLIFSVQIPTWVKFFARSLNSLLFHILKKAYFTQV